MKVVIGVGNRDRGDDGAGRELARRLRARALPGVEVRECEGDAGALMEAWRGAESAVVVDAARGGGPAGSILRRSAAELPLLGALRHASTHSFGVASGIDLARVLKELPPRVVVYAIEGRSFEPGAPLSPEVDSALEEVLALIVHELEMPAKAGGPSS